MHPPLLVDWLRQFHLNADAPLAAKRWQLAKSFSMKASRQELVELLRAFLFQEPLSQDIQKLAAQFLEFDPEFPGSKNTEEIRLMGGLVPLAGREENSPFSLAFGLGVRAAAFPSHRCSPANRQIAEELQKFVDSQANGLRPFSYHDSGDFELLSAKISATAGSVEAGTAASTSISAELAKTLQNLYGNRIQRLSEEVGILWWLLGGYSSILNKDRNELSSDSYALIAANEIADRTQLLPPPPSILPILTRGIRDCKSGKKKKVTLKALIAGTDEKWREAFVSKYRATDCADLVPLVTALSKTSDTGDISALGKALQKACPGVSVDLEVSDVEAALQLYNEILFLKALATL